MILTLSKFQTILFFFTYLVMGTCYSVYLITSTSKYKTIHVYEDDFITDPPPSAFQQPYSENTECNLDDFHIIDSDEINQISNYTSTIPSTLKFPRLRNSKKK